MYKITKQDLIAFEDRIYDLFEEGDLPYLIHLCGGNEDQLIHIFSMFEEGDYIFSTHRTHYHYLLSGGDPDVLEEKIRRGDSMFVFDRELNFFSSSILAGNTGIAAGVALSLKLQGKPNKVWCFLGDGAEDQGHLYEAVAFVDGQDLPCTFIIEDNDRSVDTSVVDRRGTEARFPWPSCVTRYRYTPVYPHASTGSGKMVSFKQEAIHKYLDNK